MNTKVQENSSKISWGNGFDGLFLLSAIVVAGFLAKLPNYSTISEEHYYVRNIGFIAFLPLIAFFVWEKKLPFVQSLIVCAVIAIAALYINFLPGEFQDYGDTVILACIHLPLFLWVLFGVVFTEFNAKNADDLMMFLRHNADLVVVSVLCFPPPLLVAVCVCCDCLCFLQSRWWLFLLTKRRRCTRRWPMVSVM